MYVLMVVTVKFLKEDLHWFCRKRTLTDCGVYMHLNGGVNFFFFPDVDLHFVIHWYRCVYIGIGVCLARMNVVYFMCFFYWVGSV